MEQMTFDFFLEQPVQEKAVENDEIKTGDTIRLITDHLNEEALNYYKYYHPETLTMAGLVVEVCTSSTNSYSKVKYKNGKIILIEVRHIKKEELAKYS